MRKLARNTIEVVDVGEGASSAMVVLRHLLQRARTGEFVGVIALLQTAQGGYVAVTTPMDADRVVGQIEFLKRQVMDAAAEDNPATKENESRDRTEPIE